MADGRQYELADFDPSDGHLHTGCTWSVGDTHPCDCAAHAYAVAARAELALYQVQTYAEGNVSAAGSRTLRHLLHVINLCEQARG